MKDEHYHALKLKEKKEFKSIEFSRISLTTFKENIIHCDMIFKELVDFIFKLHRSEIDVIYASVNPENTVYLINMQFKNGTLSNLMLNFVSPMETFYKTIELSGNSGLYEYSSLQENSYYSNIAQTLYYLPTYSPDIDTSKVEKIIANINLSILLKKPIYT